MISHSHRRYVDVPLFPSYLFIYLNDLQNYYTCMDTDGALFYVRTGSQIAKVQESVINNIKIVVDRSPDVEVSSNRFMEGQRLVIGKGPLTGLSCEVVRVEKKYKLLVRVNMLSRNILISLSNEYLLNLPN